MLFILSFLSFFIDYILLFYFLLLCLGSIHYFLLFYNIWNTSLTGLYELTMTPKGQVTKFFFKVWLHPTKKFLCSSRSSQQSEKTIYGMGKYFQAMYIYIYTHIYTYICVYIYFQAMYIYIHTYIYIYKPIYI